MSDYEISAYTSTYVQCKHENGWYDEVQHWLGHTRVFVCLDCETIIKRKHGGNHADNLEKE